MIYINMQITEELFAEYNIQISNTTLENLPERNSEFMSMVENIIYIQKYTEDYIYILSSATTQSYQTGNLFI